MRLSERKIEQHFCFFLSFLIGPIIGAVFSIWGKERSGNWFFYPAMCAMTLSSTSFLFLYFNFKETLSEKQRLKSLPAALTQAAIYINPLSLFRSDRFQMRTFLGF